MKVLGPNTCVLQTLQGEVLGKTWNNMHLKRYFLAVLVTGAARRDDDKAQGVMRHEEHFLTKLWIRIPF